MMKQPLKVLGFTRLRNKEGFEIKNISTEYDGETPTSTKSGNREEISVNVQDLPYSLEDNLNYYLTINQQLQLRMNYR